jgi:glyoxylase-like metal-dependent hydrolase (beta-lactamase superfamily II)
VEQTGDRLPSSEHFQIEQLADGVYAAIAVPGGAAFSNAGIVDLGDRTLLFDTFETPRAATDLKVAAEELAGRPATYLVISHSHADHWCGNQVFDPQVPVIAGHLTREEMPKDIAFLRRFKEDPAQVEQEIRAYQERLEETVDPHLRTAIEGAIVRMGYWLEMLPTLEFRYPNLTFDGNLVFHGAQRTVELHAVAPGHTVCDVYLHLPEDRIVLMGDLGFFQSQPFMAFCDPQAWMAHLQQMEQADVETFVPGHGPLGTKADLALQRQYITLVEERIAQAVQDGAPVEAVLEQGLPAPFDAWLFGSARWEANVHTLYERMSAE